MTPSLELEVAPDDAGTRLDAFLARQDDVGSRAQAARLIESGAVLVDGAPRPKRHTLSAGERIAVELSEPALELPPDGSTVPYDVAYEDEYLLVVDKPAGVVVHPAPGHVGPTLSEALQARGAAGGERWRPGIVHRLDRDTSGLLAVAKSDRVHRALQEMIRDRSLQREYLALVEGRPESRTGTIDAPLGRDRRRREMQSIHTDSPREARTHFEIVEALPRTSLLRVRLETGRTHQIRAHLAAIGLPVCGDPLYGGCEAGERLGLSRQFLHSTKVVFRHPELWENVACESKPPADLRRASDAAKREPVSGGPDGG